MNARHLSSHRFRLLAALLLSSLIAVLSGCTGARQPQAGTHPRRQLTPGQQRLYRELYLQAVVAREAEDYDTMFLMLDRALRIDPDAPDALFEMGLLNISRSSRMDTTGIHEGDSLLRRAVALAPQNRHYKETLAEYLLANRDDAEGCIALYEELAAQKPASLTALARLMELYKMRGDSRNVIRTAGRLEELEGSSEALTIEKYRGYMALHDTAQAIRMVEMLCADNPADERFRVLLATTHLDNGRREQGLDILRQVQRSEPDNPYAALAFINHYLHERQDSLYHAAVRSFVLNTRIESPFRLQAMHAYGSLCLRTDSLRRQGLALFRDVMEEGQPDAEMAALYAQYVMEMKLPPDSLLEAMQQVLNVAPDHVWARLSILETLVKKQDYAPIVKLCTDGITYYPNLPELYYYGGLVLYQEGRNVEAIDLLSKAWGQDFGISRATASHVFALLGDIYHEEGETDEAFRAYDEALRNDSANLLCMNNYAYFLSLQQRDLEHAADMSRATVEAEPENSTYLDTYAWILYQLGQFQQAKIYIDQTLLYAGEDISATLLDHAGDIYYRCGEADTARTYWQQALEASVAEDDKSLSQLVRNKLKKGLPKL